MTTFYSKMSKLFGKVGRVDKRIHVQTFFCPYQGTRQVGQTYFGHMSKISQIFFLGPSPNLRHSNFHSTSKQLGCDVIIAQHSFYQERVPKIKTTKLWTYVQSGSTLPTQYPSMDKNKFGQTFFCLPYLPLQKVWTFWK